MHQSERGRKEISTNPNSDILVSKTHRDIKANHIANRPKYNEFSFIIHSKHKQYTLHMHFNLHIFLSFCHLYIISYHVAGRMTDPENEIQPCESESLFILSGFIFNQSLNLLLFT